MSLRGNNKRVLFLPVLLIVSVLLLSGCGGKGAQDDSAVTTGFFAMDTYMSVRAYGTTEEALSFVSEEAQRLEKLLSVTDKDSEIYQLDHGQRTEVSGETAQLVSMALDYCEKSGGCLQRRIPCRNND